MFLIELSDIEKEAFVSLCYHASMSNGYVDEDESLVIKSYCQEMNIDYVSCDNAMPMEEACNVFIASSDKIKKIVIFEILGVMLADGIYDEKEKEYVSTLSRRINVSTEVMNELTVLIEDYMECVKRISSTIYN